MAVVPQTCEFKSGFFGSCGGARTGICVYCGRAFCGRHGMVLASGEQVCARKECAAKGEELPRHQAYRQAVMERNERQLCGVEGCAGELAEDCVHCKGTFCANHLMLHDERFIENGIRIHRKATLCQHCLERRHIWERL